ncbi:protein ZNRD2-like [Amphiura filiformis]|uniref:protein ZNRD2-like n=1 Tax=Amphiura filiformis TaxID=82378 RepID=UPI003B21CB0B
MNGQSHHAHAMDSDDFEWTPPTEAELKVIQAKRERADKISKLMGDYLLKGYKMLGTTCKTCDTILLKDRQQRDYCVACSELETEHAKDDPALSQQAAISQVQEHRHAIATNATKQSSTNPSRANGHQLPSSSSSSSVRQPPNQPAVPRPVSESMDTHELPMRSNLLGQLNASHYQNSPVSRPYPVQVSPEVGVIVGSSLEAVTRKLAWASQELCSSHSVEASAGLCNLIKSCADAIAALHRFAPQELTD